MNSTSLILALVLIYMMFSSGKGLLAKHGKYYYPACLIRYDKLTHHLEGPKPQDLEKSDIYYDATILVSNSDIVDCLWRDKATHCTIRVCNSHSLEIYLLSYLWLIAWKMDTQLYFAA